MLLVAICDDIQTDRIHIKKLTKSFCDMKSFDINLVSFENGEDLINYYIDGNFAFDIIFLDIYMNGKNGIITAKKIREYDQECKIVFTTSSTDHALESFETFPFSYLIKPILEDDFIPVLNKAIKTIDKEQQKRFTIKIGATIQTIFYKDLLFIESNGKILNIHSIQNKIYSYSSKLDDLENQISDKRFIRCHKSFLVNMDYILSVEANAFKLTESISIPITQRNFSSIKNTFFDYIVDMSKLKTDIVKVGQG